MISVKIGIFGWSIVLISILLITITPIDAAIEWESDFTGGNIDGWKLYSYNTTD
jgi:hypothetical protein